MHHTMRLNRAELAGRLGADPKSLEADGKQPFVTMRIATDESYFDKTTGAWVKRAEWHNVVLFGKPAEWAKANLREGDAVYVTGKMRTREYEDKKTGEKRFTTEVVAFQAQPLDVKELHRKSEERKKSSGKPSTPEEDLGPAFPSEAGGMDDVPF